MSILDSLPKKKKSTYEINGITLHLSEMSLSKQMQWNAFFKENKGNHELLYSHLLTLCCEEFKDIPAQDICDTMASETLLDLGNKITDLCGLGDKEEKKT